MLAASLAGLICGAGFGLRFKILLLVPVLALSAAMASALVGCGLAPAGQASADLLGWGLGLEAGYCALVGAVAAQARS